MVTGFRNDEYFIPKIYKDSLYRHSTQLIKGVDEKGRLMLQSERIGVEEDE